MLQAIHPGTHSPQGLKSRLVLLKRWKHEGKAALIQTKTSGHYLFEVVLTLTGQAYLFKPLPIVIEVAVDIMT